MMSTKAESTGADHVHGQQLSGRGVIVGLDPALAEEVAVTFDDAFVLTTHGLEMSDRRVTQRIVRAYRPDVIVYDLESSASIGCSTGRSTPQIEEPKRVLAVRWVVEAAASVGAHVVLLSTSEVFAGMAAQPSAGWPEWVRPRPQTDRAASIAAAEEQLRSSDLLVRLGSLQTETRSRLMTDTCESLRRGMNMELRDDNSGSVVLAADAAAAIGRLIEEDLRGVFHVANAGVTSDFAFAMAVASEVGGIDLGGPARFSTCSSAEARLGPALATEAIESIGHWPRSVESAIRTSLLSGVRVH